MVQENREALTSGKTKVAMFCTGGIRCEKSTAFLKAEGIDQVYHLQGGILKYLETVPADESLWEGECFVFDQRVAVGQGLVIGTHSICHACRMPLNEEDRASPLYVQGVSCAGCHGSRRKDELAGFSERQRQQNWPTRAVSLISGAGRRAVDWRGAIAATPTHDHHTNPPVQQPDPQRRAFRSD